MTAHQKIQSYLIDLGIEHEELGANAWIINDDQKGLEQVLVILEEPVVIFRVKTMSRPKENREAFYEELLRLNAQDIVHGAYALEGDDIIIIDTLEVENLDREEFQATIDSIGLALTQHYQLLAKYR
jgi:hypothetical protein